MLIDVTQRNTACQTIPLTFSDCGVLFIEVQPSGRHLRFCNWLGDKAKHTAIDVYPPIDIDAVHSTVGASVEPVAPIGKGDAPTC